MRSVLGLADGSTIVLGDYNQTMQRTGAPARVYAALEAALGIGFFIATQGKLPLLQRSSVDHVALTRELHASEIAALDNRDPACSFISDHFGVVVWVDKGLS